MNINLLEHNQMLYDKIVTEIANGHKSIFYSEGTGLGKSYIFMALVQNLFRDKKILYIVPKIAVFSNLEHYDEFALLDAHIEYKTFAAFNKYVTEDLLCNDYDVVFVDECHHMLSDIQGANVYKFLQDMVSTGKYCFGMTATPCYGGEFVDEKYFEASCYGYDIFEAIKLGLMPKIDIALANVDLSEIPDNMRASYSITGTKTVLEAIIEKYSYITHWLAYFSTKQELENNVLEMKKLFPDFKILKLYQGVTNPDKVIQKFEQSEERVVLMSVSMLLEGMHLSNVGGILLYRNVVRNSTYFQIYGRLCRLFAKQSPVLVDMTNSVLGIDDYSIFKSNRCQVSTEYSRRDIFDVNSYGYHLLEISELYNRHRVKEYRDVRWTTQQSLINVLHTGRSPMNAWLRSVGRTTEDYIDHVLKDSTYAEFVQDNYIGYYKCLGYKYTSYRHLAQILGTTYTFSNFLLNHKGASLEDYVHYVRRDSVQDSVVYRGVNISSVKTVAEHFGVTTRCVHQYIRVHAVSLIDYVDYKLKSMEKKKPYSEMLYRGVNISTYKTVAEHFHITTHAVWYYVDRYNLTLEQYIDLRLDFPEKFKKKTI